MKNKTISACKQLKSTYDASVLSCVKSQDIIEQFRQISKKYKDSKKGNLALLNLVYNYFYGQLPYYNNISGPISLSYHTSPAYDKKIYIFGELHGTINNCKDVVGKDVDMPISEYLSKVFLNTNKFIDFYLEDEMFRTLKPYSGNNYIQDLRLFFYNCLRPDNRSLCPYKTIRTHFVDIRQIEKHNRFISTTPVLKLIYDIYTSKSSMIKKHYKLLTTLSTLKTEKNIFDYFYNTAMDIPLLKKEIFRSNLTQEKFKKYFRDIIINFYREQHTVYKWKSVIWFNWEKLKNNVDLLINTQMFIVDMYTVSRMFKKFKHSEKMPDHQHNIIYYAGENHANITRQFLDKLGFELKFSKHMSKNYSTRCLNTENVNLNFL
jgi:hypothetical protein